MLGIGAWFAYYRNGSIGGYHESDSADSVIQIRVAGACRGRGPDVAGPYGRIGPTQRRGTRPFCSVLLGP